MKLDKLHPKRHSALAVDLWQPVYRQNRSSHLLHDIKESNSALEEVGCRVKLSNFLKLVTGTSILGPQ